MFGARVRPRCLERFVFFRLRLCRFCCLFRLLHVAFASFVVFVAFVAFVSLYSTEIRHSSPQLAERLVPFLSRTRAREETPAVCCSRSTPCRAVPCRVVPCRVVSCRAPPRARERDAPQCSSRGRPDPPLSSPVIAARSISSGFAGQSVEALPRARRRCTREAIAPRRIAARGSRLLSSLFSLLSSVLLQ